MGTAAGDGDPVAQWSAVTGGVVVANTELMDRPTFIANGINFNPVLQGDGDDFLSAPSYDSANSQIALYLVSQDITASGDIMGVRSIWQIETSSTTQRLRSTISTARGGGGQNIITLGDNDLLPSFLMLEDNGIGDPGQDPSQLTTGNRNGELVENYSAKNWDPSFTDELNFFGGRNRGTDGSYNGKIAEMFYFDRLLTATERQQVDSYVALKYGISLSNDTNGNGTPNEAVGAFQEGDYIASDGTTVIWDASAASTGFTNAIFGIGRDNGSGFVQSIAKSSTSNEAVVTLIYGTSADFTSPNGGRAAIPTGDDRSFTVLANNGGTNVWVPQSLGLSTLDREWQVQETGTVGGVTLAFETANPDFDIPNSALLPANENFDLIIDSNDDGSYDTATDTVIALTQSGTVWYTATPVDLTNGQRFTLATSRDLGLDFVSTWQTGAGETELTIPTTGTGYFYSAELYDTMGGLIAKFDGQTGDVTFSGLTENTTYQLRIAGDFPRIFFSGGGEAHKITEVNQWGTIAWTSFESAFDGCSNVIINTTEAPLLSGADFSMSYAFRGAINLSNSIVGAFADWEMGNVTNMTGMFDLDGFTQVTRMGTLDGVWQPDLSGWDVSNVTHFSNLFRANVYFDGNLSNWVLNSDVTAIAMFHGASRFTGTGINTWDIATNGTVFNDVRAMFNNCSVFNVDRLENWVFSGPMNNMFNGASIFDGDISTWDVAAATQMAFLFQNAVLFNSAIGSWEVGNVTTMRSMFQNARSFNQNLGPWNVDSVTDFRSIFQISGLSLENMDSTLIGWADNSIAGANVGSALRNMGYCSEAAAMAYDSIVAQTTGDIQGHRMVNCNTNAFDMVLWVKANDNGSTAVDGNPIATWVDHGENGLDHMAATANQPLYAENVANFNPVVRFNFDGNISSRLINDAANINHLEDFTLYIVADNSVTANNPGARRLYATQQETGGRTPLVATWNHTFLLRNSISTGASPLANGMGIMEYSLESLVPGKTFDIGQYNMSTSFNNSVVRSVEPAFSLEISRSTRSGIAGNPGGSNSPNTDIAELIYVRGNNNAIVESYLAVKYGLTLDQSTPTDYVASDGSTLIWSAATADQTVALGHHFNNAIIGIGRDDAIGLDQRISASQNQEDILTISLDADDFTKANNAVGNTFDAPLEYVTLAHNGGDLTVVNGTQVPAAYNAGIGRVWQAQQSLGGAVSETVNLKFEGVFDERWAVVVDTDIDFSDATDTYSLDANGEVAVTLPAGISYFTLVGKVAAPGGELNDLILWLRADEGVTNSGGVTLWEDQSSHGFDFTPIYSNGAPAASPQFVNDRLNFNPSVDFGASTADILGTNDANLAAFTANDESLQIYSVVTATLDGSPINFYTKISNNDTRYSLTDYLQARYNGSARTPPADAIFRDTDVVFKSERFIGATADITNSVNGEVFSNDSFPVSSQVLTANLLGGRGNNSSAGDFQGHILEFVMYNSETAMGTNAIESYLAFKYGITLDQTVAQNYQMFNGTVFFTAPDPVAGAYNSGIFGIGKDSFSGLEQQIAKSSSAGSILTLSTDANFTDENTAHAPIASDFSFLVLANNGDDATAQTTEMDATLYYNRIGREWQVQATNFTQAVNLKFAGFDDSWVLIKDDDGDFSSGTTIVGPLNGDGTLLNTTFAHGDYFTLAQRHPVASGTVWYDSSGDGVRDGAETMGLAAITVSLYADTNGNGSLDLGTDTLLLATETEADGSYVIPVPQGDHLLVPDSADPNLNNDAVNGATATYGITAPSFIALAAVNGTDTTGHDFGFDQAAVTMSVDPTSIKEDGSFPSVAQIQVEQNIATAFETVVHLDITGTASTVDYTLDPMGTSISLPAGSLLATKDINAALDLLVEGDETIVLDVTSVDNAADSGIPHYTVTLEDDDMAGFSLSTMALTIDDENGGTGSFTVVLDAQPTTNVALAVSSSDTQEAAISHTELTFDSSNWNVPQEVTVTGVDDMVASNDTAIITLSVNDATSDDAFDALEDQEVAITLVNDDMAGFSINKTEMTINENEGSDTFTVVLDSEPGEDVVFDILVDSNEVNVMPGRLTFEPGNWNTPQTVTVTGEDDFVVRMDQTMVTIRVDGTASDDTFDTLGDQTVEVTLNDDDSADILLSTTTSDVMEGGSMATYTLVLNSAPTAGVTIDITASNGEASVDSAMVTFDATNWNMPQTVSITATNDTVADGETTTVFSHQVTSSDPLYMALSPNDHTTTIADNDSSVTVRVVTNDPEVEEAMADTGSFTIRMDHAVAASVTVNYTLGGSATRDTDYEVSGDAVVFAAGETEKTVLVSTNGASHQDNEEEGDETVVLSLATAGFAGMSIAGVAINVATAPDDEATVTIIDDDTAGIMLDVFPTDIPENGGSASLPVSLTTQPIGNVVIDVGSSDLAEATVSPNQLVFGPTNWNMPQGVSIMGVDDTDIGTDMVTISLVVDDAASDDTYDGLSRNVVLNLTDNDFAIDAIGNSDIAENMPYTSGTPTITGSPVGGIVYSITGDDAGQFSVNAMTGAVSMEGRDYEAPLDADGDNRYEITLEATASDGTMASTSWTVTVTNVKETVSFGIAAISDVDITENSSYTSVTPSITGSPVGGVTFGLFGPDTSQFTIDSGTGVVQMTERNFELPTDADADNVYEVGITATDSDGNEANQRWRVTVTNSMEPSSFSIDAITNTAIDEGTAYTSVTPSIQGTPMGVISYGLEGADALQFTVDGNTGVVQMVPQDYESPADHDTDNVYEVTLVATDNDGNQALRSWMVTVQNVTETGDFSIAFMSNAVVGESNPYTSVVPTIIGSPVGTVTFGLTGTDASLFTIDESTGQVRMVGRDFEAPEDNDGNNIYEVRIVATDSAMGTAYISWTVTVEDVDETTFFGIDAIPNATVDENVAYTSITPSITGIPVGSVTFALAGADAAQFTIDETTGVVQLAPRDFEVPQDTDSDNVYEVEIMATDAAMRTANASWTVRVDDIVEQVGFTIDAIADANANENNTYTGPTPIISGSSPVGNVTYSLSGADAALFDINVGTGVVIMGFRDFENPEDANGDNVYEVAIIATDGDGNSDTEAWTVTIGNIVEVANFSFDPIADATVVENSTYIAPMVMLLGDLPVGDLDYSLTGADAALFELDVASGMVSLPPQDFEFPSDANGDNTYEIGLRAVDEEGNNADMAWTVTVFDMSETTVFTLEPVANSVVEEFMEYNGPAMALLGNSPIGAIVYTLGGADAALFTIDENTGEVILSEQSFAAPRDANGDNLYEVTVIATDTLINTAMVSWTVEVVRCSLNCDGTRDGQCDRNCDTNGDGQCDQFCDTDNDGECDTFCSEADFVTVSNDLVDPNLNGGAFIIDGIENYPNNVVTIFNRWGNEVYRAQGYDNSGTVFTGIAEGSGLVLSKNQGLPAGIYYYTLNFVVNGNSYSKTGYISITNR